MERPIYWRVGKDTGVFTDLKTLEGAVNRLQRRIPTWREIEVQYDAPVGSVWAAPHLRAAHSAGGTAYITDVPKEA